MLALALILALGADSPRFTSRECPRGEGGRSSRGIPCSATEAPTYLEFMAASGAGLPVISHHNTALCDALAAEVPTWSAAVDGGAGNWCLGGDGLAVGGSQVTFATFGSPTVIDTPVCPSGLDCLAATGQPVKALQTGTGQGSAATAAVASGTGAMTACWWGQLNATMAGSDFPILAHATSTAAGSMPWELDHYLGKFRIAMVDGAGNYSVSEATGDPNSVTFFCGSHAGGTGVARGYLNGTAATAGASMTRASETYKPTLHGYNGTSDGAVGQTSFGAFYVDKELTPTQIAAISRRVLADVPKAVIRGGQSYVDMSYTRTGSRFCAKADNTGSIVPANRPCISQSGYLSEAAGTNLILRSQEFDNAAWVKGPGATITSNHAAGPDSTKTAERAQFAATNSYVLQNSTTTAGPNVASVFLKGNGTSGITDSCLQNAGGTWVCTSCAFTPSAWSRCTVTTTTTTTAFWDIGSLTAINGGIARDAVDILLWGAQVETGSVATSYIPTTSAAASRGADLGYFTPDTASYSGGQWCYGVTALDGSSVGLAFNERGLGALGEASPTTSFRFAVTSSGVKISRDFVGVMTGGATSTNALPGRYLFQHRITPDVSTCFNGTCVSGSLAGAVSTTGYRLKLWAEGASQPYAFGHIGNIQFDPRPSRCR